MSGFERTSDTFWSVLDKGELEIIDQLGSDLTIVNSARVSFGKKKTKLSTGDKRLMAYLNEHKHHSPFRHAMIQLRIKAPEFVMRQWYKHCIGAETTSTSMTKDHAWNEISGRYIPITDFYKPENWRGQSEDNKQCSNGLIEAQKEAEAVYDEAMRAQVGAYERLVELGVAKEQARILLPLNFYTEVYWTCSFQAAMNFIELRDHDHAQHEIRVFARAMREALLHCFPEATSIWLGEEKR